MHEPSESDVASLETQIEYLVNEGTKLAQQNRELQSKMASISNESSGKVQAETYAAESLLRQVNGFSTELHNLRETVTDVSALYFTALTISMKLRAVIFGLPVTVDVNSLLLEVQERMVKLEDWPRFISDRIFRKKTMEELSVEGHP